MALIDELVQEGWLKTPRIIEAFRKIKRIDFLPAPTPKNRWWGPEDMKDLSRTFLLNEKVQDLAELNEALPIGYGQTISQPLVVAFMLEQIQPQPGDKILDVGSGSGWTTALLAEIVSQQSGTQNHAPYRNEVSGAGSKLPEGKPSASDGAGKTQNLSGRVIAIDIVSELVEFGRQNVAKYNFIEKGIAEFIYADGSKGYKKEAPFDKILASASVQGELPRAWKEQLKVGGRIVTPISSSIWLFIKNPPADGKKEFEEIEYPGFVFVPLIEK